MAVLSIMNVVLGLAGLASIALVVAVVIRRQRARSRALNDTHAMEVPGLGLIMADGGRPLGDIDWPTGKTLSWDDERELEVGE